MCRDFTVCSHMEHDERESKEICLCNLLNNGLSHWASNMQIPPVDNINKKFIKKKSVAFEVEVMTWKRASLMPQSPNTVVQP